MTPRRSFGPLAALAAAVALAACTLARLNTEVQEFERSTVLVGRVESGGAPPAPIVVGAWARDGTRWELAHQTTLHEAGGYELIVPPGRYRLFAFADHNGNGLFDAGEAAATRPEAVATAAGTPLVAGLDMVLGTTAEAPPRTVPAGRHGTQAGALADLDAPAFSAARGSSGYWQPMAFFRELGGNVYFLEPYDARKTPVLFVHGAAGSAQDWRPLIAQLDRERFQPWLFHYPSGAPVESMASLLGWKLLNLQLRHRFDRLVVVAHSMGGLVVRRFLLDHGATLPQARHFVSLSTPWGGEAAADTGVRLSPAVVPSWRNMQPDGAFLQGLFARPLPPGVQHDLLFSHRGGYTLWRPNHDGTVTLASQLRDAAQREARLVFGFDEDHTSILRSPQVARQLALLLASAADARAGARLEVRLDVEGAPALGMPSLVLQPLTPGAATISAVLASAAGGGRVGPLPAGRYRVGLIAPGFAAEPRIQEVVIDEAATLPLRIRLRPDGCVSGFVQRDSNATPAGTFGSLADSGVREIRLRGAGVERTLVPQAGDDAYLRMAAGEDAAVGAGFLFSGLREGRYELTIVADGLPPHRSTVQVVPGQPPAIAAIRLGAGG